MEYHAFAFLIISIIIYHFPLKLKTLPKKVKFPERKQNGKSRFRSPDYIDYNLLLSS